MNPVAIFPQVLAATPGPGVAGDVVSAQEAAARDGDLTNPDRSDVHYMETPFSIVQEGSPYYFQTPPGIVTRQAMHPAGPVGTVHRTDFLHQGGSEGLHGELVQQIQSPDGTQTPVGVQAKTWRADPSPWDTDIYVGWTPATPQDHN